MKIAIGSDHAGFKLKEKVKEYLESTDNEVVDFGTYSEESTDYPDYAHKVAEQVENGSIKRGVLICGSGNGISMAANKHKGIRAALCWIPEVAEMARLHNDANIISLPARYIDEESALKMVKIFLETEFEGGRHQKRIDKIPC
jgi:ribose 5-phosphate isomerase B